MFWLGEYANILLMCALGSILFLGGWLSPIELYPFNLIPGATYTEQNGFFTNLEGKLQKAYKASYPPGEAKEDWQIINELAEFMNNRKLFNDKDELDSSMLNYLNLQKENSNSSSFKAQNNENFKSEDLKIEYKDYYFSNVIARSSKTMLDCHNSKLKIKRTGTDG